MLQIYQSDYLTIDAIREDSTQTSANVSLIITIQCNGKMRRNVLHLWVEGTVITTDNQVISAGGSSVFSGNTVWNLKGENEVIAVMQFIRDMGYEVLDDNLVIKQFMKLFDTHPRSGPIGELTLEEEN